MTLYITTGLCIVLCLNSVHSFFKPSGTCPSGWLKYESDCYLFGDQKFTFTEAEIFCLQNSSHLIEVVSYEENEFIRGEMKKRNTGETYWLGMKDDLKEGDWHDIYHLGAPLLYADWYPGQPNPGDTEDCMCAPPYFDYHWGDYNCNDRCCYAICRQSLPSASSVIGK